MRPKCKFRVGDEVRTVFNLWNEPRDAVWTVERTEWISIDMPDWGRYEHWTIHIKRLDTMTGETHRTYVGEMALERV